MFVIVWQFEVKPEHAAEFESQYGSAGAWAQFFSQSDDYLGTRLLRDAERPRHFITLDFWKSEAAFQEFKNKFHKEYQALDSTFECLTVSEKRLGTFVSE
ncbi:MAG: antibiotic biosynthesis monooxygenase family protein [bacterium]